MTMEHGGERFVDGAIGWVVHAETVAPGESFWQGPDYGDGKSAGPLRDAMYWASERTAHRALVLSFGSIAAATRHGFVSAHTESLR